jgi:hypothetical protein
MLVQPISTTIGNAQMNEIDEEIERTNGPFPSCPTKNHPFVLHTFRQYILLFFYRKGIA